MKKLYWIVPACLQLASMAGHAQGSVTLYGLTDIGIEYINHVPVKGQSASSAVREESGNLAGSRFGLKGSEDLGNGLKAIFTLENGYNLNNGTLGQSGRMFGRKAFVGLSTPWGQLTLGRHQNLMYELMYKYDALTLNPSYSAQSMDGQLVGRVDNAVRYSLQLPGVRFAALYSTGFDSTIVNGANVAGATKVGREISAAILIDRGAASVGLTFDQIQGTSIATQSVTQNRTLLGASYDFGQVKAFAGYRWLNVKNSTTLQSSSLYWGGLTYQATPALQFAASVYHTQYHNPHGGPTMGIALIDYSLSKQTDVYIEGAYVSNRSYSNVGVRGVGLDVTQDADQTGVTMGIRHLF